ncbi:MAG: DNA translocase FtsK [Prevotellaceae bacterium]|jgi:S-DNA-T family DNA segregation ATPase FtsK/SpoIIIE|nr:DNA translocase FtsK [Prevotellaceae bacterium]
MTKKGNSTGLFSSIKKFFSNTVTQVICGLLLFCAALYLFAALASFVPNGSADSEKIVSFNQKTAELAVTFNQPNKQKSLSKEVNEIKNDIGNICGYRGAVISEKMINEGFGLASFLIVAFVFTLAIKLCRIDKLIKKNFKLWKSFLVFFFLTIWVSVFFASTADKIFEDGFLKFGGGIGMTFFEKLHLEIKTFGVVLVLICSLFLFLIIAFSRTIPFTKNILEKIGKKSVNVTKKRIKINNEPTVKIGDEIVPDEWIDFKIDDKEKKTAKKSDDIIIENIEIKDEEIEISDENIENEQDTEKKTVVKTAEYVENLPPYNPRKDLSNYKFPEISLLKQYPAQATAEEDKTEREKKIVETLKTFGIGIKQIFRTIGPTITLYEIVPAEGVRINKIRNLADDIMLSLAAIGIRIIAPIPGKGTIGIEVPNTNPKIVSMFDTIASKKFQDSAYDLPVVLGRTITNEVFMFDLCKMPHLLVAGATGQGKSVGLNAIITSLLYKKHPAELKFVLIDPKKVEFNIYADIERHFLAKLPDADEPVITDTQKVVQTLNSLCKEMDLRYDLLKMAHSRNIKEYNEKFISRHLNPEKGHRFLPYIVVIVDEFGDLIMTAGKEVEMPIARIAQLARAVGMHMIIATQRPSVNIITGVIKANFPARIAFKVSSGVDSKTILDGSGAQQLIGRGDMLFSQGNEPTRVQCAFVDTPEVENIVHFIGDQQGYPTAFVLPEPDVAPSGEVSGGGLDAGKRDSMFDEVARLVVQTQMASASNIQRKFSIGFARAARLVDQLEAAGIVGAQDGSKPRQVLISTEYDLEKKL